MMGVGIIIGWVGVVGHVRCGGGRRRNGSRGGFGWPSSKGERLLLLHHLWPERAEPRNSKIFTYTLDGLCKAPHGMLMNGDYPFVEADDRDHNGYVGKEVLVYP